MYIDSDGTTNGQVTVPGTTNVNNGGTIKFGSDSNGIDGGTLVTRSLYAGANASTRCPTTTSARLPPTDSSSTAA